MEAIDQDTQARVLVVEGDRGVARMLRFSLRSAGFRITEAPTGVEALRILDRQPPDAVVLDLSLPDGLAPAVLGRLCGPSGGNTPYPVWVVISSLDREEATRRYGPLGSRFLPKPFDPWDLVKVLEDLLSARGSE
jgi:DNA-binding response OmpR family regulator